jgi:hypothetical protein
VSGLETAIRNALDRSERANPEVRARIYQSARQALEAGLRKQDVTDVETISSQRQRLEATIRAVEGEERARLQARSVVPPDAETLRPPARPPAPQAPQAAAPRPDPVMSVRGETRDLPSSPSHPAQDGPEIDFGDMRADAPDHLVAEPERPSVAAVPAAARSMDFKPERAAGRRKPRKFFSRLLIFCILLAFVGVGAWWVKSSGLLLTAAQRDTSVRNPPAHVDAEDYDGNDDDDSAPGNTGLATIDPQDGFSKEWVDLLKPTDIAKVTGGAQAKAESVAENDGPAIRVTSQTSGADGNAAIEIPANVLQQMAGKASTIALTLQATSQTPTQITVECDFQSLGSCGRHRFDVTRERSDALFQIKIDKSQTTAGSGKLIINSDVDGKAQGVNIYAIRILPGE